jgi:hypothetical protein
MEADPDLTHSPVYLKIEGEVLSPFTSVPFGAPTKAPSFLSNCLCWSFRSTGQPPARFRASATEVEQKKRADPLTTGEEERKRADHKLKPSSLLKRCPVANRKVALRHQTLGTI